MILNTHKACYFQKILPVSLDVLVPPYPPRQAAWATSVPCYKCLACDEEFHCDGHDIGVLHMGDFCVSQELLKDFMKLFIREG